MNASTFAVLFAGELRAVDRFEVRANDLLEPRTLYDSFISTDESSRSSFTAGPCQSRPRPCRALVRRAARRHGVLHAVERRQLPSSRPSTRRVGAGPEAERRDFRRSRDTRSMTRSRRTTAASDTRAPRDGAMAKEAPPIKRIMVIGVHQHAHG